MSRYSSSGKVGLRNIGNTVSEANTLTVVTESSFLAHLSSAQDELL